jgi:hypothetical protein
MRTAEYITKPGDRWDQIAYKSYGTINNVTLEDGRIVNALSLIIETNPLLPIDSVLEPGLLLNIPIIPNTTIKTQADLLPPWK